MSLRDQKHKITNALDNLKLVSGQNGFLSKLEAHFGSSREALKAAVKDIHKKAAESIVDTVRQKLRESYHRSGIKTTSEKGGGAMYNAVLAATTETYGAAGIRVSRGKGYAADVYARAGAFQFGSIRGSKKGGRAKRKMKKNMEAAGETRGKKGESYVKPKPFFLLTSAQMTDVGNAYRARWNEEVNKIINKRR